MTAALAAAKKGLSVVLVEKAPHYGGSTARSGGGAWSAASMREMGYLNGKSIAGGFDAWQAAGKPVAKPELPSFG